VGTGLTMEAIEQNPVIYELMSGLFLFPFHDLINQKINLLIGSF
jgi:hypothetical protein